MDTLMANKPNKNWILNQLLYFSDDVMRLLGTLGETLDATYMRLGHGQVANQILMKIGELKAKKVLIDKEILSMYPSTRSYYELKKR